MNPFTAFLLIVGALVAGALLWSGVRPDTVGRRTRVRRTVAGLQGKLTDWLYWDAPLKKPNTKDLDAAPTTAALSPADRALQAVVRREALELGLAPTAAYEHLKQRVQTPVARAFLEGEMGAAVRAHWRRRYRGRPGLFYLWFYLIALIRYGKRHLYLETLSAALQELKPA